MGKKVKGEGNFPLSAFGALSGCSDVDSLLLRKWTSFPYR